MMHKLSGLLVALIAVVSLCGCDPGSTEVQPIAVSVKDVLKANLQSPADTGALGSELTVIEENIEKLATEDAAKSAALKKDLEELKKANNASKIKAKAKEMIGKL